MRSGTPDAAILLMAHGTPESVDQMADYLRLVRGGREPSEELILEMTHNWEAIGGRSPLTDITLQQGQALANSLPPTASPFPFSWGCETGGHSSPMPCATSSVPARGVISGFRWRRSFQHSAFKNIWTRRKAVLPAGAEFSCVRSFHDHPLLVEAFAEKVLAAQPKPDEEIVFTAHSLPQRVVSVGDPYPDRSRRHREGGRRSLRDALLSHRVSERGTDAGAVARTGSFGFCATARSGGRSGFPHCADRLRVRPHRNPVRHRRAGRRGCE